VGKTISKPRQRWLSGRALSPQDPWPRAVGAGLDGLQVSRELLDPITVSVICPTRNRQKHHETLYRQFAQQEHPDKELWVIDDSPQASPFFMRTLQEDPRVHYEHAARISIGDARNRMIRAASGAVIAHFDDDDVYAPNYLASMLQRLRALDVDLVKLSIWTERNALTGRVYRYDGHTKPEHDLWGWGFSYVYRRSVASRVSFPAISHAEDIAFVKKMWAAGMKTALVTDGADWVQKRYTDHPRHFL
jgi:glycosyltransferase involved in cell wall biosynthesis